MLTEADKIKRPFFSVENLHQPASHIVQKGFFLQERGERSGALTVICEAKQLSRLSYRGLSWSDRKMRERHGHRKPHLVVRLLESLHRLDPRSIPGTAVRTGGQQ